MSMLSHAPTRWDAHRAARTTCGRNAGPSANPERPRRSVHMRVATRTAPGCRQVDIWRAPLDLAPEALSALASSLSRKEHAHAQRFRSVRDRDRFKSRRGWLRRLLGEYLGAEPSALKFRADEMGKPQLEWPDEPSLHFSVSSSTGLAVYAVASTTAVGVDIECLRPDFPMKSVAHRFFDGVEQRAFEALFGVAQVQNFFETWTRKEAYLKGIGIGLSGLDAGLMTAGSAARSWEARGRQKITAKSGDWSLGNFDPGAGYAAAVAVEARGLSLPSIAQPLEALLNAWW